MKGIAILSSLFLLIVLAQSFGNDDSSRLLQSSTRTATVGKLCASFSSRATIVDDKAKADADTNKNTMKSSFKVDGYIYCNTEILCLAPRLVTLMVLVQD